MLLIMVTKCIYDASIFSNMSNFSAQIPINTVYTFPTVDLYVCYCMELTLQQHSITIVQDIQL